MLYDQPKKMSDDQLEHAWFGSIWENPGHVRRHGVYGLDRSMFKNKTIFDWGLEVLRDPNFSGRNPTEKILREMMEIGFVSKLEKAADDGLFNPGYYKFYCEEIEKRNEDPSWMT